jgi:hypothetical protein
VGWPFQREKEGVLFNVLCGDRVWICALAVVFGVVVLVLVSGAEKVDF